MNKKRRKTIKKTMKMPTIISKIILFFIIYLYLSIILINNSFDKFIIKSNKM